MAESLSTQLLEVIVNDALNVSSLKRPHLRVSIDNNCDSKHSAVSIFSLRGQCKRHGEETIKLFAISFSWGFGFGIFSGFVIFRMAAWLQST